MKRSPCPAPHSLTSTHHRLWQHKIKNKQKLNKQYKNAVPCLQKYSLSSFHNSYIHILFPFLQLSQSRISSTSLSYSLLSTAFFLPPPPSFYVSSIKSCLSSKASHTFPSFHRSNFLSTAFQSTTKQGYKVTNISSIFLFLSQKLEAIKINLILVFNTFCSKTSAQR